MRSIEKPSKMATLNKFSAMYNWAIKRHISITILYFAILLLTFPTVIILELLGEKDASSISRWFVMIPVPVVMLFTLIICGMLFYYLYSKKSIDLFNSLPINRYTMVLSRYFAGLTLIITPLILNAIIAIILSIAKYSESIPFIINSVMYLILGVVSAFTFSVVIAICSGALADMIISILTISVIYPAAVMLILYMASSILPGYDFSKVLSLELITSGSPYFSVLVPHLCSMSYLVRLLFITWWLIFSILALWLSIFLYKKRKSEVAQSEIAFSLPSRIIKFGFSLVAGIIIGIIFIRITGAGSILFWVGLLVGSFLANVGINYIYERGFKNFLKNLKTYLITICILLVSFVILITGCLGYDKYIPKLEDIESVSVSGNAFNIEMADYARQEDYMKVGDTSEELIPQLKEIASIKEVLDFHSKVLDGLKETRGYPYKLKQYSNNPSVTINYKLKNGLTVSRSYKTDDYNSMAQRAADEITDLEEYKLQKRVIFKIEARDIASVEVKSPQNKDSYVDQITLTQKSELLKALKEDYLQDTSEKQFEWSLKSDKTDYLQVMLYSYGELYDNPDMKRNIFEPSLYVVPSYYINTINVINKYNWVV